MLSFSHRHCELKEHQVNETAVAGSAGSPVNPLWECGCAYPQHSTIKISKHRIGHGVIPLPLTVFQAIATVPACQQVVSLVTLAQSGAPVTMCMLRQMRCSQTTSSQTVYSKAL